MHQHEDDNQYMRSRMKLSEAPLPTYHASTAADHCTGVPSGEAPQVWLLLALGGDELHLQAKQVDDGQVGVILEDTPSGN